MRGVPKISAPLLAYTSHEEVDKEELRKLNPSLVGAQGSKGFSETPDLSAVRSCAPPSDAHTTTFVVQLVHFSAVRRIVACASPWEGLRVRFLAALVVGSLVCPGDSGLEDVVQFDAGTGVRACFENI